MNYLKPLPFRTYAELQAAHQYTICDIWYWGLDFEQALHHLDRARDARVRWREAQIEDYYHRRYQIMCVVIWILCHGLCWGADMVITWLVGGSNLNATVVYVTGVTIMHKYGSRFLGSSRHAH